MSSKQIKVTDHLGKTSRGHIPPSKQTQDTGHRGGSEGESLGGHDSVPRSEKPLPEGKTKNQAN